MTWKGPIPLATKATGGYSGPPGLDGDSAGDNGMMIIPQPVQITQPATVILIEGESQGGGGGDDLFFAVPGATGSGTVSSVSNSDGTMTISPTMGAVVVSVNQAHAFAWTAAHDWNLGALTNTKTAGIHLDQTVASTGGSTLQNSPAMVMTCRAWDMGGSADHIFDWYTTAVGSPGNPVNSIYSVGYVKDGGSFTSAISLDTQHLNVIGGLTITDTSNVGNTITGNAASSLTTTVGGLTITSAETCTWSVADAATSPGSLTVQAGTATSNGTNIGGTMIVNAGGGSPNNSASAAGAGGPMTMKSGPGGANSSTGAGGASGAATYGSGAGGNSTSGAGGASGTATFGSGAGGNAGGAANPGVSGNADFLSGAAGTGGSGNAGTGHARLDSGAKQGTGTAGTVLVADTNAPALTIGNSGCVVTTTGTMQDGTGWNLSTSAHGFAPKAPNSTTQFLRGDASWASVGGTLLNIQVLAAGTTAYTPTTGTTSFLVEMWAGGGGGAGVAQATASQMTIGVGGGAGCYMRAYFTTVNGPYTCTVGAGGGGGTGAADGSDGGGTSLTDHSSTLVASINGGSKGLTATGLTTGTSQLWTGRGGAGGTSNGSSGAAWAISMQGGQGRHACRLGGTNGVAGDGGDAFGGSGGVGSGGTSASANGANGAFYGGGGAGAIDSGTATRNGGSGGDGLMIIYEYR